MTRGWKRRRSVNEDGQRVLSSVVCKVQRFHGLRRVSRIRLSICDATDKQGVVMYVAEFSRLALYDSLLTSSLRSLRT